MNKDNLGKRAASYASSAVLAVGFLAVFLWSPHSAAGQKKGWDLLPEILSRIVPPAFPDRDFDVTDYGARGDGVTDCRPAFDRISQTVGSFTARALAKNISSYE